jgi:hypothetical protein
VVSEFAAYVLKQNKYSYIKYQAVIKRTNIQTTSCFFLLTGLASSTQPTDINGISSITEGINHALPTQK